MDTYYDNKYISQEPVRYLFDVYSIGFIIKFSKEISITPKLEYTIDNKLYSKNMQSITTVVDGLQKIVFGPLFLGENKQNPTEATISIVINCNCSKNPQYVIF